MPAAAHGIGLMVVGLAWKVIDGLAGGMLVPLAGDMTGFGIEMLTEMKTFAPVLYAIDARSGVMNDMLADTVASVLLGICVDVVAIVDADICAGTTIALDFILFTASSPATLFLGREYSCWRIASWYCRDLHTRIPSCHV